MSIFSPIWLNVELSYVLFFDIGFGIVLVTTWMMFFFFFFVITGSKWKFRRPDFSLVQTSYTIKFPVFQRSALVGYCFLLLSKFSNLKNASKFPPSKNHCLTPPTTKTKSAFFPHFTRKPGRFPTHTVQAINPKEKSESHTCWTLIFFNSAQSIHQNIWKNL